MSPQQTIAHYRIVSKLGEGGMGAVYRATDTKLGRDVAIKVLPSTFAADAGRMARFEREAQVLASLNHPNIAAIYGIEQGAIVMELVEGADLAGPLPIDTVIDYARQIATGLEAAHEKGIVHRDLKPANIKVTPDGLVKILDFGLAKPGEDPAASSNTSLSPTMSLAMTQAGMILGTAAYMSPEQARGKTVDRRADIWAYGIILYELLTGQHLYGGGETVTDILAAIVIKEPDLTGLPADTPPRLRRVIERCLRKDPKMRLRDIGEARVLLDEPEPQAAAPVASPVNRRTWLPWALAAAGLALGAVAAGVAWMRQANTDSAGMMHFLVPLPNGTSFPRAAGATQWVPSPDGRNIAMILLEGGNSTLWVRPLNSTAAHRLDKTEGANYPFWSPDGQSIGFIADEKLKRIALSGGAVQTVCDIPAVRAGRGAAEGGAWGPDGFIVFSSSGKSLMRVPAKGGVPSAVTSLGKDELSHEWPQLLPDGKHVLYLAKAAEGNTVYVQEIGSKERVAVMKSPTRAMWSPAGYLLFVREGNLFTQRMNSRTYQLEGEPLTVAEEVTANEGNGRNTFAVSQNGLLIYRSGVFSLDRQLTWRDRAGKVLSAVGKPGRFGQVVLSPDEKSAAVYVGSTGKLDLWVMDLGTGVLTPMTSDGKQGSSNVPVWSSDSTRVAFSPSLGGIHEATVASGKLRTLIGEPFFTESWSPDGSILARDYNGNRLSLISLSDPIRAQTISTTPYRIVSASFSPDGKFLAYQSTEASLLSDVYVASFPSFSVKRRISASGGTYPVWGRGGKSLYYRSGEGFLTEVDIRTGSTIEAGVPKSLFKFGNGTRGNRFCVTADGQRFLISEPVQSTGEQPEELHVVVNWAEVKQ